MCKEIKDLQKADIANAIAKMLNCYCQNKSKVEWPDWGFIAKIVFDTEVDLEQLEKVDEKDDISLWTFKAVGKIQTSDGVTSARLSSPHSIIGNIKIQKYLNPNPELKVYLPTPLKVVVTDVKQLKTNLNKKDDENI